MDEFRRNGGERRVAEFQPVCTVRDLESLDDDEIFAGFQAGLQGTSEPYDSRGRSYWHGWRNGAVEGGYMRRDDAQRALSADIQRRTSYS
ncbi:MAG: hypothetical protein JWO72_1937 [Caulobacteraceae bacterium]|nr:hypothetical protein [Caulobacteraceae bacterium]